MRFPYGTAMNLSHLRYFIAVAEHGSTTRAAQVLHISQPAVTRGIKLLEEELGVALFDRLPRTMQLTRFGQAYLRHARAVFAQLDNGLAEMRHLSATPIEEVIIGAGPTWLMGSLPGIAGRFSRLYPGVSLRIRGGYDRQLLEMLNKGEVDFVLTETSDAPLGNGLVQEPLISCEYIVACRRGHPLAARSGVSLTDLQAHPWAMPDQAANALDRLSGLYLAQNLRPPKPHIRSTSLSFILNYLLGSDALSFVVKSSLHNAGLQDIVAIDVEQDLPIRHAGIVQRRDTWESPVVAKLLELLRDECRRNPIQ